MEEEVIAFDIHRKIERKVTAFGVEGSLLFFMMGWLILCFIFLMILKTLLGVILASVVALFAFLIVGALAAFLSQRFGIEGIILKAGSYRQPAEIISTSMNTSLYKTENETDI